MFVFGLGVETKFELFSSTNVLTSVTDMHARWKSKNKNKTKTKTKTKNKNKNKTKTTKQNKIKQQTSK